MMAKKGLIPPGGEGMANNPFLEAIGEDDSPEESYSRKRKHHPVKFHDAYEQFTSYIHRSYNPVLDTLMDALEEDKTALFNEAFYDLFLKYRAILEQEGVEIEKLPPHPRPS